MTDKAETLRDRMRDHFVNMARGMRRMPTESEYTDAAIALCREEFARVVMERGKGRSAQFAVAVLEIVDAIRNHEVDR